MPPPGRAGGARRLFGAGEGEELGAPGVAIARLLEDGDSADLAWLVGSLGGAAPPPCRHASVPGGVEAAGAEPALAAWLARHGARQLSRRSRAFWRLVLASPADLATRPRPPDQVAAAEPRPWDQFAAAPPPPASTALWPL